MRMQRKLILITMMTCCCFFLWTIIGCAPKVVVPQPTGKPAKVAVVLGAGSAKGFAHIGVLKVLESNKVPIHMIVGTSAGGFVGAVYAYGYNAYQLQNLSFAIERDDVFDLVLPDNGFVKGDRLQSYVE